MAGMSDLVYSGPLSGVLFQRDIYLEEPKGHPAQPRLICQSVSQSIRQSVRQSVGIKRKIIQAQQIWSIIL
jgi:hypothetical protein